MQKKPKHELFNIQSFSTITAVNDIIPEQCDLFIMPELLNDGRVYVSGKGNSFFKSIDVDCLVKYKDALK